MSIQSPGSDARNVPVAKTPIHVPLSPVANGRQGSENKKEFVKLFPDQVVNLGAPLELDRVVQFKPGIDLDIPVIGAQMLIRKEIPKPEDPHASLASALELATPLSEAQFALYSQQLDEQVRKLSEPDDAEKAQILENAKNSALQRQQEVRERLAFLQFLTTPEQAKRLSAQYRVIPLINDGIQWLRDAYDATHAVGLDLDTQARIALIHENLNIISEVFQEVAAVDKPLLAGITLRDFSKDCQADLKNFWTGNGKMTWEHVAAFREELDKILRSQCRAPLPERVQPVKLTDDLINQQIGLQQVARKGKAWMLEQAKMERHGKSLNFVQKVLDTDGKLVGYFKIGVGDDTATAIMEHFMYDAAVVMGVERKFAPTGRMAMMTQADLAPKGDTTGPTIGIFDPDGTLRQVKLATHTLNRPKGSIQAAQRGCSLNHFFKTGFALKREDVIESTALQIGMGMFDAHGSNVIVDKELMYFDNACSFPNSNRPVRWLDMLRLPFRSALFQSPEMYTLLTEEDRSKLKNEAMIWRQRAVRFRIFLDSPVTEKRLQGLPGWWDSKAVLSAMEERIESMEKAASDPDVRNLRDFTLACYPDGKFFAAVHMVYLGGANFCNSKLGKRELLKSQQCAYKGLSTVGYQAVDEILNAVGKWGADVFRAREICRTHSVTFEDLVRQLVKEINARKLLSDEKRLELADRAMQLSSEYIKSAVLELKDIPREDCLFEVALQKIPTLGIPIVSQESGLIAGLALLIDHQSNAICLLDSRPNQKTIFKTLDVSNVLDGVFTVEGDDGLPIEIGKYCREAARNYPFYFHLNATRDSAKIKLPPKHWLLRPVELEKGERGIFMVSLNTGGKVRHVAIRNEGGVLVMPASNGKVIKFDNLDGLLVFLRSKIGPHLECQLLDF